MDGVRILGVGCPSYVMVNGLVICCPYPEILCRVNLSVSGLTYLAEEISRHYSTQAESWILFSAFSHDYTEDLERKD